MEYVDAEKRFVQVIKYLKYVHANKAEEREEGERENAKKVKV
jgi:hypothetical protein